MGTSLPKKKVSVTSRTTIVFRNRQGLDDSVRSWCRIMPQAMTVITKYVANQPTVSQTSQRGH